MSGTKVVLVFGEVTKPGEDFYGIHTFQVMASNLDTEMTTGLCGSLNSKKWDDLIPRNEKTAVGDPEYFAESWRLKGGEEDDSLFNISKIKPHKQYAKPYCVCRKEAKKFPWGKPEFSCNYTQSMDTCSKLKVKNKVYKAPCKKGNLRTERDLSHILRNPSAVNINYDNVRLTKPGQLIRHRREVSEFDDDDAPVMYAMNITDGESSAVDLSWKNSWTEDKARRHCTNAMQSSPSFSVCESNVQSVPSSSYIDKCVADIRLTGESSWDSISVNNFGTTCLNVASKVENLTQTNDTNVAGEEVSIFDLIQAATCPKNCSGNGKCIAGQCVCTDRYFGAACDVEKTQAPKLSPRAFSGLCDISLKPCHKFIIPGLNYVDGNLTCRYRHFSIELNETTETGIIETANGIYNTPFAMQCHAPSSRHKRSLSEEASAFGYFMSVSNDGKNFTQDLTIIVYDSLCYECNTANLTCTQVDTCPQLTPVISYKEKSHTGSYIGAGIGGALVVIVLLLAFTYFKKTVLKGRSSVKDSTTSLQTGTDQQRKEFLSPASTST